MSRHILNCLTLSLFLFLLGLNACSQSSNPSGLDAGLSEAPGGLILPAPNTLPRVTASLHTYERGTNHTGPDSVGNLEDLGLDVRMTPNSDGNGVDGLAYAGFVLAAQNYEGAPTLDLYWSDEPDSHEDVYVALSNGVTNRWEWHQFDENYSTPIPADLSDYQGEAGFIRVVVVLTGTAAGQLGVVRLGGDAPPIVKLTTGGSFGDPPIAVNFNASESYDADGSIVSYEWDPEGDGTFELGELTGLFVHQYNDPGQYQAKLRVTDNEGNVTIVNNFVVASTAFFSDEFEDNDTPQTPNLLPSGTFSNFRGDVGPDGPHDGDNTDYFLLDVNQTAFVQMVLTYILADADVNVQIYKMVDGVPESYLIRNANNDNDETADMSLYPGQYLFEIYNKDAIDGLNKTSTYDLALTYTYTTPPTPKLVADPDAGDVPWPILLDSSASFDDSSIASYAFDLYGDGHFEVINGDAGSIEEFLVKRPGHFRPALRVTDNDGFEVITTTEIFSSGPSDELEPNDSTDEAQTLPALPFIDFHGDIGGDADNDDTYDSFKFNIDQAGTQLAFHIVYDPALGHPELRLYDGQGNLITDSNTDDGQEDILYDFAEAGDYQVAVFVGTGAASYLFSGEVVP